jgi:hypothetical protein
MFYNQQKFDKIALFIKFFFQIIILFTFSELPSEGFS